MRLITIGLEAGDFTAEGVVVASGTPTIVTTTPHGGARCLSCAGGQAQVAVTLATARDTWVRFYLRFSATPTNALTLMGIGAVPTQIGVRLNTNGSLDLLDATGAQIGSSSNPVAINTWVRVEVLFNVGTSSTGKCELRVDGSTISGTNVANANLGAAIPSALFLGNAGAADPATVLIDDVALNDSVAGTGGTTWPGDGKIVMLVPTSDNSVGLGWTLGTGTAISANSGSTALKNEPPVGVADLAAGSDVKQIRNATSNANASYVANMTTYTAAGLVSSDTITLVQPLIATAAPSATSAKTGTMSVSSNPSAGGITTSFTFYQGATIAGVYPSGWHITRGVVIDSSNTTLPLPGNFGTAPQVAFSQVTGSTRIAMACFAGLMVEYLPRSTVPLLSGLRHRPRRVRSGPPARGRF